MSLIPLFQAIDRHQIRVRRCGDNFTVSVRTGVDSATWTAFIRENKQELLYVADLMRQAYPEGAPAHVPLDVCLLCGWWWPCVRCVGSNGVEGLLCVGCVAAESRSGVNRARCETCEQTIAGRHYRTDPGGPIVCLGCWQRNTAR